MGWLYWAAQERDRDREKAGVFVGRVSDPTLMGQDSPLAESGVGLGSVFTSTWKQ